MYNSYFREKSLRTLKGAKDEKEAEKNQTPSPEQMYGWKINAGKSANALERFA